MLILVIISLLALSAMLWAPVAAATHVRRTRLQRHDRVVSQTVAGTALAGCTRSTSDAVLEAARCSRTLGGALAEMQWLQSEDWNAGGGEAVTIAAASEDRESSNALTEVSDPRPSVRALSFAPYRFKRIGRL